MRIKYELDLIEKGKKYIAGVDEAGRGPLAGPLVVAAVILNPEDILAMYSKQQTSDNLYMYINDSKQLTKKRREELDVFIKSKALFYSVQVIENTVIDTKGIVQATQMGFFNSIKYLGVTADYTLTDHFKINALSEHAQSNILKGDSLSITVAAASILAKVHRDKIMEDLAEKYPVYGFEKHKGYGTKAHKEALFKHGPCDIHRKSFEPVKSLINK